MEPVTLPDIGPRRIMSLGRWARHGYPCTNPRTSTKNPSPSGRGNQSAGEQAQGKDREGT